MRLWSDRLNCLFGREVPALVLAGADVVDGHEDAEDHEDAHAGERAVAGLPPREEVRDLAPLAERVEEHADEARPGKVGRVLLPGRIPEADRDGDENQRRPEPSDRTKID